METQAPIASLSNAVPPRLNALKHGMCSEENILPDEDPEAFARLRREQFLTYRPRTRDEAECLEAMVSCQWLAARCRRWQRTVDANVQVLLLGGTPQGHICDPDQHRWFHNSRDCVDQQGRLHRMECRAREKLLLLQKLRRNELIVGAVAAEPIYGWSEVAPAAAQVSPPAPSETGVAAEREAGAVQSPSPSQHGEIRNSGERTAHAPEHAPSLGPPSLPRKARRALERRLAKEQRRRNKAAHRRLRGLGQGDDTEDAA